MLVELAALPEDVTLLQPVVRKLVGPPRSRPNMHRPCSVSAGLMRVAEPLDGRPTMWGYSTAPVERVSIRPVRRSSRSRLASAVGGGQESIEELTGAAPGGRRRVRIPPSFGDRPSASGQQVTLEFEHFTFPVVRMNVFQAA
jgi:hypothetical protein